MSNCSHYTAALKGALVCDRCGAPVPAEMESGAKDDLTRIMTLFGTPDHDVSTDAVDHRRGGESRVLEYTGARVLFTFLPEAVSASDTPCIRWKLLLITDTASQNSMTATEAAHRFQRSQHDRL
jgi:hypothetical protein